MKRLILGLVLGLIVLSFGESEAKEGFVKAWGHRFVVNGSPYYANGFNAYWLMYMASDPSQSYKVSNVFKEASSHGLTVARTWAFSDGGDRPLQFSPGSYNEETFKGLDLVVSEARKHGIKLILSLVNNYESFGGKKQYVNWGRSKGQYLTSHDDFFTNSLVKGFYKNHVSTVLNRYNSLTGLHYKDDPTIMAWELMNEPRCTSDPSGRTIQGWITEMASHVKSIDRNHMLEAGLEGFYGDSSPGRKSLNPALNIGTDFIANNRIPGIDFATVHCYPDQWLSNSDDQTQMTFLNKWLDSHISDAERVLRKPLMVTEFGKSGYSTWQRDRVFGAVYSKIFASAKNGGVAAGGLFWQLLTEGMESYGDSYAVVLSRNPSTAGIIAQQSRRLIRVRRIFARMRNIQRWKKAKAARRAQNRGKQIGG